ncbi:GntR family transcriptional regulator [Coralliovum pocilloporae]|uniref:GntR family transcriptional regulator n=1 Tax=Coralliovum pocilloporae TaxID=3066369 RepID=UPI0033079F6F
MTKDIDASHLADIAELEGSLAQRVYQTIREAILSLDFPPGAILRKGAICDALGVSRSPVSEAIARLSAEGLVNVVPQSATRVSYFSMWEIREGSFLREALELAAVAKVAEDVTDEQIAQLSRNMRLQQLLVEDGDYSGFYQTDEEFHGLMMQFTGFKRVTTVASTVSLQVTRARMLLLPTQGRVSETLVEHQAIVDAIKNRDPSTAQDVMRFHLRQLMPRIEMLAKERPDLFLTE